MAPRVAYATIRPVTRKGKWLVISRHIGSRERFGVIATCDNECSADLIVDALNAFPVGVVLQAAE